MGHMLVLADGSGHMFGKAIRSSKSHRARRCETMTQRRRVGTTDARCVRASLPTRAGVMHMASSRRPLETLAISAKTVAVRGSCRVDTGGVSWREPCARGGDAQRRGWGEVLAIGLVVVLWLPQLTRERED